MKTKPAMKKKHIKKRPRGMGGSPMSPHAELPTPPSPSSAPPIPRRVHLLSLTKLLAQVLEAKVTALEGYVICLHADNARLASGILADDAEHANIKAVYEDAALDCDYLAGQIGALLDRGIGGSPMSSPAKA